MRRADRLFEIIQYLRTRELTTARWLSEKLEVSERTIYRDIQDLICSGVPIEGAAGMGYVLHKTYDLPPIMFSREEVTSLIIGIKMAMTLGGKVANSAEHALSKINAILPTDLKQISQSTQIYTPPFYQEETLGEIISTLNHAIIHRNSVAIEYKKLGETTSSHRVIYPLGVFFWKECWTLVSWCTLREAFRTFRLDRIEQLTLMDEHFKLAPEQRLTHFLSLIPTKGINVNLK